MDKLQGQHVSGVVPENLLPELASFWKVPGRPAQVLISHGMSAQKGLIQPPWGKAIRQCDLLCPSGIWKPKEVRQVQVVVLWESVSGQGLRRSPRTCRP